MTGTHPDTQEPATRPISVAELLARNGTIGSPPVSGRRRRRRGNSDAVTVAELTGEIPIIRDQDPEPDRNGPPSDEPRSAEASRAAAPAPTVVGWSEPGPRWPKSMPQTPPGSGPEHSHYPRPVRRAEPTEAGRDQDSWRPGPESGAEQMSPDPVDSYTDINVVELDIDDDDASAVAAESAPVRRSYLGRLFGKREAAVATSTSTPQVVPGEEDTAEREAEQPAHVDDDRTDDDRTDVDADFTDELMQRRGLWAELLSGVMIVVQSMLAVLLGAGLFIAFDQLWRWNSIVALVLTVLVTLGLVAAVQAVRRTVDIGSTLVAVAVGLLMTLGPLALHAN